MKPYHYWKIIKERKWIVISAFVTTVLTTLIGSLLWPPLYEAIATIVLDYDSSNPMNLSNVPVTGMVQSAEYINTQVEIIKSRKIALDVIDSLGLDKHPDVIREFNEAREGNPLFFWKKEKKDMDIRTWLADRFLSRHVKVEPARDTRFLYIKFYSSDPNFSAEVANTYAKAYSAYNLELKVQPFKEAGQWFSEKLKDVKSKADKASEELREYQKKKGFVSVGSGYYDDALQRLDQINRELVDAKAKLYEATVAMRRVNESKGNYESLPEVISNAFIQNLKTEKIRLEMGLSELSGKVGKKHPQYLRLQSELQTVNTKLNAEIKNIIDAIKQDYDSATLRVNNLQKALASHKSEVLNLNISRYEVDSLNRETEAFKNTYDIVLQKFNESALQGDINRTNVFLVDMAIPPLEKYSPKLELNMALALLVGLFLGIGLAFFFDYLDDTIKSEEVLEKNFGIPVLGTIRQTGTEG
ncbi:MAG: GNVR domain-containing protein [Thermodesulfovibrionales bacterium]